MLVLSSPNPIKPPLKYFSGENLGLKPRLRHLLAAAFMIVAYEASPACQQHLDPLVHVDGTVRPQVVESDVNPLFHALIRGVERESGHPVLLNTSFNVRGEPIICTPLEAIRGFYSTGLEALVIGSHVLTK